MSEESPEWIAIPITEVDKFVLEELQKACPPVSFWPTVLFVTWTYISITFSIEADRRPFLIIGYHKDKRFAPMRAYFSLLDANLNGERKTMSNV